ncbi:Pectin lyase fold/virulence factor [Sesbania bispinosa]|nr:Pectin lyase fold/virulence factor [Sesbania bispinosa]
MGNGHGHGHGHRKHRNSVPHNTVPPPYIYGPSSQPQPSSTIPNQNVVASNSNIMNSLPYAHVDSTLRALATPGRGLWSLRNRWTSRPPLSYDGPGSLRDACRRKEPLWIVFEVSVLEGGRGPDVDGIQIKPNSKHIWIDRCSLSDFDDGLIDITRESTDITISRCHFAQHDKTMLIGADPSHVGDRLHQGHHTPLFFSMGLDRGILVLDLEKYICTIITPETGAYMLFVQVWNPGQKKVAFKYLTEKAADKGAEASGHISEYYPTWTVEPPTDELKQVLHHCTGWQSVARPADQTVCAE